MNDGDEDVDTTGESTSAVVVDNRLAANRLAANRLAANRLAANRLAANRLAANRLELNQAGASELLETDEGREVLSFIVSCAVKEGETLVAEHNGETFEFFGEVGLANRWLDHPVDDVGAGWVSACLFARVNASNVPIPISLRGPSNKLTASPEEKEGWTLQEGAFFGNYFVDEDEDIDWNACQGSDQAAGETGALVERDCTEPDGNTGLTLCGFKYAGMCGDFAEEHACKQFNEQGTFYKKCQDNAAYGDDDSWHGHGHGHHGHHKPGNNHHSKVYKQVITVYLTP